MIDADFFSRVYIYRDDLNHSRLSGNKLHKLAPNIKLAKEEGCKTVLSFGGPYSNHLHALAWASRENSLSSIGIVRGELHAKLTPTLKDCQSWGMQLIPLERKVYRFLQEQLLENDGGLKVTEYLSSQINGLPDNTFIVPEGGSNLIAIQSLAQAYRKIFKEKQYEGITHVVCATGTGATLAGLYRAAPEHVKVIGVQAVAEGNATCRRISKWLGSDLPRLTIMPGHLGGFAKTSFELLDFIKEFEFEFNIPLDHIYNGKVFYKLQQIAKEGCFLSSDRLLVIHTGGLQGTR